MTTKVVELSEVQRDEVRSAVRAENEKLVAQGLGKHFLGRTCPISQQECLGPYCPMFLLTGEDDGSGRQRISGGNCSIPLMASQFGPLAGGLLELAKSNAFNNRPMIQRG